VAFWLTVHGAPPKRHDPGECADRSSPDARPLFDLATNTLAESPDAFPIRHEISVVVTSRRPLPEHEGYGPAEAMIEVLVDAGFLADERLVTSERYLIDPDCPGYSITVEPEVPPGT
jgi:hypothetical protein